MMSVFEAAWVIARRDFVATVYSRSFILFLLVPVILFGAAILISNMAEAREREASHPVVAVVADTPTQQALAAARARLVAGTSEQNVPLFENLAPAENVTVQAGRLLADEEAAFSAVFIGSLEQPILVGPMKVDDGVATRIQLLVDLARRAAALESAGASVDEAPMHRVVTAQAAGNLQMIRRGLARAAQALIFTVTVMLATLLLSNMAEEKSSKVIEVLAAAVPLDAVFLGKLVAMLGISMVGLMLWGGMLGIGYLFLQVLQDFMTLPSAGPAVGWPVFILLVLVYYATNYMLLGALFLGIGGQASNIREIQTLSMPVTLLQVFVFLIAMNAVGSEGSTLSWVAYVLPFCTPLAMVAHAAQFHGWWPHLVALVWQLLWILLIIRLSSRLFRATVLKSSSSGSFLGLGAIRKSRAS